MRPFLLFLSLVYFNSLNAQEFLPLVKEGATWSQWSAAGAPPDPTYYANWTYQFIGDTLVNGLGYKKLMTISESGIWWPLGYTGVMREDSGQVYYLAVYDSSAQESEWCVEYYPELYDSVDFSSEVLLYDFNMAVGDTLYGQEVIGIDSINLGDGIMRKRLMVEVQGGVLDYWVEGIGSDKGLIEGGCFIFENEYGLACYIDSSFRYPQGCTGVSNASIEPKETRAIYPNPTNDKFKLTGSIGHQSDLIIRNMLGEVVLRSRLTGEATIEVGDLQAGIYTVSILRSGAAINTQRLVIAQH